MSAEADGITFARLTEERFAEFRSLLDEQLAPELDAAFAAVGVARSELAELARARGDLRAATVHGETVGYVWIEVRERVLHVHGLFLLHGARGRGLGGHVLRALEEVFRDRVDAVELAVHEGNRQARRLYDRSGFREVEHRPDIGFTILRKPVAHDP